MPDQLAQLNIARLLAPLDSPQLADFVAQLDEVNAIADAAPGFVWRLQDASGNATAIDATSMQVGADPPGDGVIVNLSVWESVEALRSYVFGAGHVEVLRRRREWFAPMASAYVVLWWVPSGHRPTLEEAHARLELLDASGPTQDAFTLRTPFPARR
jgi:hypothetical protein